MPNAHVFTAVIGSFGPAKEWEAALTVLRRMQAWGVAADGHTVEASLKVCGLAGRWAEASELVTSMEVELGVRMSSVHLTTVLDGMVAAHREAEALSLLRRVRAHQPHLSFDTRLCESGACPPPQSPPYPHTDIAALQRSIALSPLRMCAPCSSPLPT